MTKARARFSIGIDLGTTNSALAFAPLVGDGAPEILFLPQWQGLGSLSEMPTLPSFLYLPEETVAGHFRGGEVGAGQWIVGLFARMKAIETPGRVVHSAKSWLCHHAADRSAPFLPWGSAALTREQKISPVRASALILNYLRGIWNSRFAEAGFAFDDQEITVTVPASFDAAAQRLTIVAAEEAGFPDDVRLLEEPQAAFYSWLETHDPRELWQRPSEGDAGLRHVLVIDIGGGTSDFSIFELRLNEQTPIPDIRRVAVSEHNLLGGDNIDLAIAHFLEPRLAGVGGRLAGPAWDQLVAACRHLKENALAASGPPDERFVVALVGRGSGVVAGSQATTVTRAEIEGVLLDGFFPFCDAGARPYRTQTALREWGLPYPSDSGITRHLAEFLSDRPRVDAVLFNGGSIRPPLVCQRLCEQIGAWQDGLMPLVLANEEPELAVARGAARFGALLRHHSPHIAAGAAAAIFLEVGGMEVMDIHATHPPLVCVLPQGAAPSQDFEIADLGLKLRTDQLVRFQAYSSTRQSGSRAGDILSWSEGEFHPLPPLQTIVRTAEPSRTETGGILPIGLTARMNALGLLQISCVSADPGIHQSWPLEFDIREHVQGAAGTPGTRRLREASAPIEPNAAADALEMARRQIGIMFGQPAGSSKRTKLAAATILKSLEPVLGSPRSGWNGPLLRALWPALEERLDDRWLSVDHEEAFLIMAGFLLRPGFGVVRDDLRIDALWRLRDRGPSFPGRRIKSQEYILWRRVAGGLPRERQNRLLAGELDKIRSGKAPDELVRLAGSLELIPHDTKAELVRCFIDIAVTLARAKRHCAAYLAALGLLLNRTLLYAGPEAIVSPDLVEQAYSAFHRFDWTEPDLLDLQTLFLRAARVVDDRSLDLPILLRTQIVNKLEKSGMSTPRTATIKGFIPIGRSDRASLYDESLPPGLILGTSHDNPGNS